MSAPFNHLMRTAGLVWGALPQTRSWGVGVVRGRVGKQASARYLRRKILGAKDFRSSPLPAVEGTDHSRLIGCAENYRRRSPDIDVGRDREAGAFQRQPTILPNVWVDTRCVRRPAPIIADTKSEQPSGMTQHEEAARSRPLRRLIWKVRLGDCHGVD